MNITSGVGEISRIYITEAPALDPVTVLMEDFEPGVGRITIICWGSVWTSFWGGMSGRNISSFFCSCDDGYLISNLSGSKKQTKAERVYLARVVAAVKEALSQSSGEVQL